MKAWVCAALGRSAAEKGGAYLTATKVMTEQYPFWAIITESGSGLHGSFLLREMLDAMPLCVGVVDYA